MRVFISYAQQDIELAKRVRDELVHAGLTAWTPDDDIYPGDNWAEKIGRALEQSDAMVALVTRDALASGWLRKDIQFALTSKNYGGRVIPIFVGFTTIEAGKDVPWILLRLTPIYIESAKSDLHEVVQRVRSLAAETTSNAAG